MALEWLEALGAQFIETAFGYGVGGAISPAIAPFVQDLTNEAWSLHPVVPLAPPDLANMVVQNVLAQDAANGVVVKSGVSVEDFDLLVKVNGAPIAPDQALDLWNRGEISEDDVTRALLQSRLKPEWVDTFKLLRVQILQVADLASMVVQNVLDRKEGEQRAAMLGFSSDDFDRLVRLSGNPPGPETVLTMWNRGIISEEDATLALLQSRLKPEWVEQFKQTRYRPATTAQAVDAVVRERITMAAGAAIAAENGVDQQTFALLVDEAGRPIGNQQAVTLFKRGEFTKAQVQEVVARSNVRTEYVDAIIELGTHYPSLYQIKAMIETGALSDKDASDVLTKEGYTPEIVQAALAAGHGVKLAGSKQLTQAAISAEYQSRGIDKQTAAQLLAGLGYDDNDTGLLLGLWDYQAAKSYRDAAIAVVKARYLQSDIDEATASNLLDQVGLPPDQRDAYLGLWAFDVQANPTLLTLGQLNAAVKAGIVTPAEYSSYLPRLNYQTPEIDILVALYATPPRG